ncbi:protein C1orf43 homolog isoform X1 [Neomonachus schauinslandi]|uniref:Protein C1orf43 homolog isoform X1 n=1 Tax=Neomonachus schauinslandi TaxID=29088 RepID=A0A2Y9GEX6_NEOSC|nr:protein C1orf43 homolog isoform X1 [Neomonachus schauinslandi]
MSEWSFCPSFLLSCRCSVSAASDRRLRRAGLDQKSRPPPAPPPCVAVGDPRVQLGSSRRGGFPTFKDLKEEIDIRLSRVQDIKYEPQLLADGDARLLQLETQGNQNCYNYLYRMKALDAIRASEIPFHAEGRHPRSLMGKNFRSYLLDLRNTSTPFKGVRKALIDTLLDGYETARYGTGVFGQSEYLHYQEALSELATVVKARSGSSQRQHQSAAKDLTQSPEVSPTTIQVTYLPSSQKSKRAKHFLELKSFKDNYNTLESTL